MDGRIERPKFEKPIKTTPASEVRQRAELPVASSRCEQVMKALTFVALADSA